MKKNTLLVGVLLSCFYIAPLFAGIKQDKLKIPADFLVKQELVMDEFLMEDEKLVRGEKYLSVTFNKNKGHIIFVSKSSVEELKIVLDETFRLINKEVVVKDERYIEAYGVRKRTAQFDEKGDKLLVTYYLSNLEKEQDSMDYVEGMLWQGVSEFYLQAMLMNGVESFEGELFADSIMKSVGVQYNHQKTNDIAAASPQYKFPMPYSNCLKFDNQVNLFEMEMTGFMSVFFSDKFYYAFSDVYPYELLAAWGGKPEDVFFDFNKNHFNKECLSLEVQK